MKNAIFLSILSLALSIKGVSQENNSNQNKVEEEFNRLIQTSNDYQGYKVVDYNELIKLKNTTTQIFTDLDDQIVSQKNTIDQQQAQINNLREDLEATQMDLNRTNEEKDAITFLGMPFSKGSYKTLMWGIVGVLILALVFFIFRYRQSHSHTKEARTKLYETEKDFDAYREKALEKEQRLGRLLQDERNKSSDK